MNLVENNHRLIFKYSNNKFSIDWKTIAVKMN